MKHKGYTGKEVIDTREVQTVAELIEALQDLLDGKDSDIVYVESGDADRVQLRLVKNTLTDGSCTFDIRVS